MSQQAASVRIRVAPVSAELAPAVRALRVTPAQAAYVGDVAFNLADAQRDPLSDAMAVLAGDRVVGCYRLDRAPHTVSGRDLGEPTLGLRGMLIDRAAQGRGYGTLAVRACCEDAGRRHPDRRLLVLAVHCGNHAAIAAYARAGFHDTGQRLPGGAAGPQQLLLRRLPPEPAVATHPSPEHGNPPMNHPTRPDTGPPATDHRTRFLQLALRAQALRFGDFTLKSGRPSPYFFNAGRFDSGAALVELAGCYADAIDAHGVGFDLLFGPAYKGIPLATALACEYARRGRDLPLAFNRKEAKAHGEGGSLIGAPLAGRRVLIVDDVITAGTAIREALAIIAAAGGSAAGIVIALDRQEVAGGAQMPAVASRRSAAETVAREHGLPVIAVASLDDVLAFAVGQPGLADQRGRLMAYRDAYGCDAHP